MAGELPAYTAWVRTLRCSMCQAEPCGSVHHAGPSGMGQRPHDRNAVPLCQRCHVEHLHSAKGWARGMEKRNIKAWEACSIELTQRRARDVGWFFHPNGAVQRVNHDNSVEVF